MLVIYKYTEKEVFPEIFPCTGDMFGTYASDCALRLKIKFSSVSSRVFPGTSRKRQLAYYDFREYIYEY